jgi:hypothetical protein
MADLEKRVRILEGIVNGLRSKKRTTQKLGFIATAGLTSTDWDGDAYSTTAKTLIDLSAVFGLPSGIKAVLVRTEVRDSASAANDVYMFLSPNNSANVGIMASPAGLTNDLRARGTHIVPCDENGDIYYQIVASGANTFDVKIEVWGYWA